MPLYEVDNLNLVLKYTINQLNPSVCRLAILYPFIS